MLQSSSIRSRSTLLRPARSIGNRTETRKFPEMRQMPYLGGHARGHEWDANELRMTVCNRRTSRRAFVSKNLDEREPAIVRPVAKTISPGPQHLGDLIATELAKFGLVMRALDKNLGDADARRASRVSGGSTRNSPR